MHLKSHRTYRTNSHFLRAITTAFALLAVASCANSSSDSTTVNTTSETSPNESSQGDRPQVVVTYSVLGSIVSQLVGDSAEVTVIIPDGQDPHEFQPSAKDIETMNNADFIVANGLNFEEGLEDSLSARIDSGGKVFMVGDHVKVRKIDEPNHDETDAESQGESNDGSQDFKVHAHGGVDPHLWLSPATMLEMLPALTAELSTAIGVDLNESESTLTTVLKNLDAEISNSIAEIGECNLVSGHDELGYFADRYKCQLIGAIIPSFTTTSEATAGELADLKKLIAQYKVPAIFTGLGTNPDVAKQLADELGVKAVSLSTHFLNYANNYQEFMRNMVNQITEALG